MNQEKMTEIIIKYTREINLLLDSDRNSVRNALKKLIDFVKEKPQSVTSKEKVYFFENYILKNFLTSLTHFSDSVRESSLDFLTRMIKVQTVRKAEEKQENGEEIKFNIETSSLVLKTLLGRINGIPYSENIEEIRVLLLKTLSEFLKYNLEVFKRELSEVVLAVDQILQDKYSECKIQCCALIKNLSEIHPIELGLNSKNVIIQISKNCLHQHTKVRRVSLETLESVIILPKAHFFIQECLPTLNKLLLDKSTSIREIVLRTIFNCLMNFELDVLSDVEDDLLLILLNGLNDDSLDVQKNTHFYLETYSERRKTLFITYQK